jgi:hypothetical protein
MLAIDTEKISKLIGATEGPVRLAEALELGEKMNKRAAVLTQSFCPPIAHERHRATTKDEPTCPTISTHRPAARILG